MALYHTYRPQDFASLVGQEHIVQTLRNQVIAGTVSHAYLFSGPRGVGKTSTARILAKAINCPDKKRKGEPEIDTDCAKEIAQGRSIDVIEIDAASHTGVDSVRQNIIENAQFKPTKSAFKIFIIDEVHMLSTSAFNALLKIMEEPPSHVMFVLATTEIHKVPDTIVSRCQRFDFKRIPYDAMKQSLEAIAKAEKVSIDADVLDRIINKSDGCQRDAISLLDQLMALDGKNITAEVASLVLPTSNVEVSVSFLSSLLAKDQNASLQKLHDVAERDVDLYHFAYEAVELLRYCMIAQASGSAQIALDINANAKKELADMAKDVPTSDLVRLIDLFLLRRSQIRSAPIALLPLELLIVEWCDAAPRVQASKPTPVQEKPKTEAPPVQEPVVAKKEEEAAPEPETPAAPVAQSDVTLDAAKSAWAKAVQSLETSHPSLVFILKMAKLSSVAGDTLQISVSYSFHQEKLMQAECKLTIEDALEKALGARLQIHVDADPESATPEPPSTEMRDLAAALGGEVV